MRERGLKYAFIGLDKKGAVVAPLAGAWIEMAILVIYSRIYEVAPLAGAWIEMERLRLLPVGPVSLPLRERGLKSHHFLATLAQL